MIAQGQKYSGESRKIFEKLKREHIKTVNSNQSLYVTRYSL